MKVLNLLAKCLLVFTYLLLSCNLFFSRKKNVLKMSENPWDVADATAFLLYSCPECQYQEVCQDTFIQHAVNNHERVSKFILL